MVPEWEAVFPMLAARYWASPLPAVELAAAVGVVPAVGVTPAVEAGLGVGVIPVVGVGVT